MKEEFLELLKSINREGIDDLIKFIESTGTQYIDTGIKPNKNTFKLLKHNSFFAFFIYATYCTLPSLL